MKLSNLTWCMLAASSLAGAQALQYDGVAVDAKSGAKLYTESHVLDVDANGHGQRVVLYSCTNGTIFGRKTVTYDGSFAPNFALVDDRLGYREGVRSIDGTPQVFVQSTPKDAEKHASLAEAKNLVADSGFDIFVRQHWAELDKGETLRFQFLVPSRLEWMDFKLSKQGEETIAGIPATVIRLSLGSWFSFALPHMDVAYAKSNQDLLRFTGMSNIRDLKGDNYEVRIDFNPAERHAAAADAMEKALSAPLHDGC